MPTKFKVSFLIGLLTSSFLFNVLSGSNIVWAVDNCKQSGVNYFSTAYDISYVFTETGQAQVSQKVSFTNLKETCSIQNYLLTIPSDKISAVSASDNLGGLPATPQSQNDGTTLVTVRADANQQIVGLNKTQTITVNYSIDGLAVKRGKIWEVNVQQIEAGDQVTSFQLVLKVPNSFGKVEQISPNPTKTETSDNLTNYYFGKESLSSSGIGASFGDFQEFSFTLKYHYKNTNLYNTSVGIALPPDTEYQAVYYQSIDPRPNSFAADQDGNYIANFVVKPGNNLTVVASGLVRLADDPKPLQVPLSWTDASLQEFTKADKYIETQDPSIQKEAKQLKTPQAIYNFVSSTLKYDFTRLQSNSLGRRGAVAALASTNKSICTDFADLFVALARANGIPARGLVGFAYTDNTNLRPTKLEGVINTTLLHAWAEYWDKEKGRWVQVDPTWSSTTGGVDYFNRFDTNHFAFVINGASSQYPVAASPQNSDDIKVDFSDEKLDISPKVNLDLDNDSIISGFLVNNKLTISNPTGRAIFRAKLSTSSDSLLGILNFDKADLGIILPFSTENVILKMRSNSLIDNKTIPLVITLTGYNQATPYKTTTEKKINVKPFFSFGVPQILLIVLTLTLVFAWAEPRFRRRSLEKIGKVPWQT